MRTSSFALIVALIMPACAPMGWADELNSADLRRFLHPANSDVPEVAGQPVSTLNSPATARDYDFPKNLVDVFNSYPKDPPYYAIYETGQKTLLLVAAKHGKESFEPIERIFKTKPGFQPQVVIVEADNEQIANQVIIDGRADQMESYRTAQMAKKSNIPVLGGELKPVDLLSAFLSETNFKLKDFEGFYIVRTIASPPGRRSEKIQQIVNEFQNEFDIKNSEDLFSEKEFRAWYQEKNGREFNQAAVSGDEVSPAQEAKLFTQRVAVGSSKVRNIHLGELIAQALNTYDRVLVVYGASHQVELNRALEKMLGVHAKIW